MFRAASEASTLSVIGDWANADETVTKVTIAIRQTIRSGFIRLLKQEVSALAKSADKSAHAREAPPAGTVIYH
jgi:hypothetical protein